MTEQRTHEWFAKRKGRITGSIAGAILGVDPWRTPDDIMRMMVREWHGAPSEFEGNVATEYGTFHEENAVFEYELYLGKITPCGFFAFQDWLGASPDGLLDDEGIIEIKCPFGIRNDPEPEFKSIADLPHYYAQMQIEMLCADRRYGTFYQWTQHAKCFEHVERDNEWLDINMPRLRDFYRRYLIERENQEKYLEPKVKSIKDDSAAKKYEQALADFEAAKAALDEAKQDLIKLADGKKSEIGSLIIYPVEKEGSVSYAKAIKDLLPGADLEPYRGKPSEYWVVKKV